MIDLALILTLAAAAYGFSRLASLPVIPILMLMGILLSVVNSNTGFEMNRDMLTQIVELGLAFLLFSAGIELNPRRFKHQTRAVVWVSVIQFTLAGAVGFGVARALGYDAVTGLYIGFAVSASSTLVVVRQLKTNQQMFEPFGRLVTGVLLLQDLAMIAVAVVLVAVPGGLPEIGLGLGGLTLIILAAGACHQWLIPWLITRIHADDEVLLLTALAVLFGFIGFAAILDVPLVAGAFLAGFALSAFPVNGLIRGLLGSLSDFFQAIFFVALGAIIIIPAPAILIHAVVLAVLVLVITPPIVAAVAEWQGASSRSGIESGLLLAQTSEFALVLALAGVSSGQLSLEVFSMIALVTVVTMTWTPFVATDKVAWKLLHFHPERRRKKPTAEMRDHVVMLGFGSNGMWAAKPILDSNVPLLVVDDDPIVIEELVRKKIPCLRGDASDPRALEQANVKRAKAVITAIPRPADVIKILKHVEGTLVFARTFEKRDAERIRRAGGVPILTSDAAKDNLLAWLEKFGGKGPQVPEGNIVS